MVCDAYVSVCDVRMRVFLSQLQPCRATSAHSCCPASASEEEVTVSGFGRGGLGDEYFLRFLEECKKTAAPARRRVFTYLIPHLFGNVCESFNTG